jgi:hypothetical protein
LIQDSSTTPSKVVIDPTHWRLAARRSSIARSRSSNCAKSCGAPADGASPTVESLIIRFT